MRFSLILFSLLSLSLFSFNRPEKKEAAAGEWFFLGDKNVGFGIDHDVIHFGNWRDDVRQVRLRITDGPLKMYDMKIYFDNGSVQDVTLRKRFAQGSESRVIDLEGGLRHLNKIEFWYETRGFIRGKSRVAVWGRN
ncbi:MAG: hypothetical protein HYZ15_06310 [Sphingobacteriales bacterium]|nr:hypothetical protein [Sphingobacteriales bacterium]